MPAFTTIIAGIGAIGAAKGAVDARKEQKAQAKRLKQQETEAKEAALQEAQVVDADADFILGTTDTTGSSASAKLLKKATKPKGTAVGGLKGTPTKIGGL